DHREWNRYSHQRGVQQILEQPLARAFLRLQDAAGHRLECWREAGGQARGVVPPRKILAPQYFETAGIKQPVEIRRTKVIQVAWHIHAVPGCAEQQELPASGVGNLNDQ